MTARISERITIPPPPDHPSRRNEPTGGATAVATEFQGTQMLFLVLVFLRMRSGTSVQYSLIITEITVIILTTKNVNHDINVRQQYQNDN